MECRYCRAQNAEDDHRCQRCGRRLRVTQGYTGQSAAAPELRFEQILQTEAAPQPAPGQPAARVKLPAYQQSLFSSREFPRVVPFETIAPAPPPPVEPREPKTTAPRQRARKPIPGQQSLEFSSSTAAAINARAASQAVIYCDSPVAIPVHRLIAAAFDASIITIATALFMLVFYLLGGQLTRATMPLFGGIAVVFTLLYNVLWALGDGDSAGMQWAHLRLVNFDGRSPDREQRFYRLASGCVSFLAAGLGLLWALVDEEALTWHDHMSKTFPTPY
jgi:uncharacterized RDD family membrane protein YckC